MGCGSSREVGSQPNGAAPNGNVRSDPASGSNNNKDDVPKHKDEKPKSRSSSANSKRSRKSSTSSSSSSSSSSSGSKRSVKDVEKQADQVDGVKTTAKQVAVTTSSPEKEEVANKSDIPQTEPVKEQPKEETKPEETQEPVKETEVQEKPNFDKEVLKRFIDVDAEIKGLSSKDRESLRTAEYKRLVELHTILTAHSEKVEDLKQKSAKEYQDVVHTQHPSVKAMFINQDQHEVQLAKEMQEYIDALNLQEVAEQKLESIKDKYKNLYNAYNSTEEKYKEEEKRLQELQLEQETILGQVFNDSYGSDKEWKLEMELDLLAEKRERVQSAHFKWTNAQKFMRTATGQINWAARRWAQIATHNVQEQMAKYQMSAETRNHLIAVSQNIKTVHKFLEPIRVPYYSVEDLQKLESLINTIFHDVQVPQRYQNSYTCFVNDYNKCQNLLNWIDQVLSNTITKDLSDVKKEYHEKYYELKEERMTLIQAKIKEKLGVEMSFDFKKEEYKDESTEVGEGETVAQPGTVEKEEGDSQAPEAEAENDEPPAELPQSLPSAEAGGEGESTETPAAEEEDKPEAASQPAVKAVPLTELAPAPNQQELFGDIEQLKKKHEEEIAEFEKAQEINKARVDQGLQERLQARRNRRRKLKNQNEEAAQLGGESDKSLPPPPE